MYSKDTIVSTITPTVGGSVCLIRLSGENAISVADKFFSKDIHNEKGGTFHFGRIFNSNNEIIDEVILYLFRKPKSYTGEDVVEISCHNNIFIVDEVIDLFIKDGCRLAEPGEYSKRAFLNGKMDLAQAEAVADIIASKSRQSLKNSIHILEGKLSARIDELKKNLIDIASLLELEIDFSEEDIDLVSEEKYLQVVDECLEQIGRLIASFSIGRRFQKGIEVLITGKPNVGKSSLMNALLGKNRVIVSHIPGTTRDLIHEDVIFEDVLVRLIDTAGLRLADDEIEKEGVERARQLIDSAEIVLVLIDVSEKIEAEDKQIIDDFLLNQKAKTLLIANKIDKPANTDTENYIKTLSFPRVQISAKNELKIDELKNVIYKRIKEQNRTETEEIIISNKRQFEILKRVKGLLDENKASFLEKTGFEFIAADLRITIDALSEITGEITTDDILNNIFSNFCIGK
jgi:tRNA modification GTPase